MTYGPARTREAGFALNSAPLRRRSSVRTVYQHATGLSRGDDAKTPLLSPVGFASTFRGVVDV